MSAATWAEYCGRQLFNCHRGAFALEGATLAFGNDGYLDDKRSRQIVALFRRNLAELGIAELDFAVTRDGSTWAMVLGTDEHSLAFEVVWEAARNVYDDDTSIDWQRSIAATALGEGGR